MRLKEVKKAANKIIKDPDHWSSAEIVYARMMREQAKKGLDKKQNFSKWTSSGVSSMTIVMK